jgi:hypothetical protein
MNDRLVPPVPCPRFVVLSIIGCAILRTPT